MLDSFKISVGKWIIKRKLIGFDRKRSWLNLSNVNSVIILSNYHDDPLGEHVSRMCKYFTANNKVVKGLFYSGKNDVESFSLSPEIELFGKNNLNFWLKPKEPRVQDLSQQNFDLLVDLSLTEHFPLIQFHALSAARMRVSAAQDFLLPYSDMSISLKENENLDQLTTQIKHYLNQINQNNHVSSL